MKQKLLLFLLSCLISSAVIAQIPDGQLDDFQDNTTQGWFEGGASPNPPVNVPNAGPLGAGDNCLSNASTGTGGPGGKMIMRNTSQWAGDYSTNAIIAIKFDARALTNDLDFRVAMNGAGGPISSSNFVTVTAGGPWTTVVIPIAVGDMQVVNTTTQGNGFDVAATLGSASEFRILSNPVPSYEGEFVNATMEIDNIEATTTLSISDFGISNEFSISPNPSTSKLNISLSVANENASVEVFDILGKRIFVQDISQINTLIHVSQWDNGVYLVKVSTANSSQTKRFIKQ